MNTLISFLSKYHNVRAISLSRTLKVNPQHNVINIPFATPETILPFSRFLNPLNIIIYVVAGLFLRLVWRYDFVIASTPPGSPVVAAFFLSIMTRSKLVVDIRDDWESYFIHYASLFLEKWFGWIIRRFHACVYSRADLISSVTPSLSFKLASRTGRKDIITVLNGITLLELESLGNEESKNMRLLLRRDPNEFLLMFIGHETPYYRLDILLKSFEIAANKNKNLMLLIVGSMKKSISMFRELQRTGISVRHIGEVDHITALSLLRNSDVSCIPFDDMVLFDCALPTKVVESFILGIPILFTGPINSEIGSIVSKYRNGIRTQLDEVTCARAIQEMYNKRDIYKRKARKYAELAAKIFIREKNFQKLSESIERLG